MRGFGKQLCTNFLSVFQQQQGFHSNLCIRHYTSSSSGKNSNPRKWTKILVGIGAVGTGIVFSSPYISSAYLKCQNAEKLDVPHLYHRMNNWVRYKGITLPTFMLRIVRKMETFTMRESDVFVISHPRSGTTWTQELVYLIANDADFDQAKAAHLDDRFPYMEYPLAFSLRQIDKKVSPRFLKSHLPYDFLKSEIERVKPKVIYVARNPKDVTVSQYHLHTHLRTRFVGTVDDYADLFCRDLVMFAPWSDHVLSYWKHKDDENILFLKYENMKKDLQGTIKEIANFLGKPLSEDQIKAIVEHCSFQSMKVNEAVNYQWWDKSGTSKNMGTGFMRKGKVGDWKEQLSPEMKERIDAMTTQRLQGSGLTFDDQ